MSTYTKADESVTELANEIMCAHESHRPKLDAKIRIDYLFAHPAEDADGKPTGPALRHHGCRALAITRKVSLRDRTKGNGDAEISLDVNWWNTAGHKERAALLDHELTHIDIAHSKSGAVKSDDLGRPVLKLKPHDYEFGWFTVIASRHGEHSQERIQAAQMMEEGGQCFWPEILTAKA
jgi:hypothetical protein